MVTIQRYNGLHLQRPDGVEQYAVIRLVYNRGTAGARGTGNSDLNKQWDLFIIQEDVALVTCVCLYGTCEELKVITTLTIDGNPNNRKTTCTATRMANAL